MSTLNAFLRCESGGPAAELVLLLPLLTLLMFAGLDLGYYFYSEHQVIKGVRDGARYASRQSFVDMNCTGGSPATIPSGVVTAIQEVTRTGETSGGTARVPGWVDSDVTVSLACISKGTDITGIYTKEDAAPVVTVTADVAYQPLFAGFGITNSTFTLQATQESAVMGI